jgi:hypothetical protein
MGDVLGGKPKKPDDSALKAQQKKEELRLAEADDEVARRKALATSKAGGRSLLVSTSERGTSGMSNKLGGD